MNNTAINLKVKDINIENIVTNSCKRVAPLWELRDLVAVNPFVGYSDTNFLDSNNKIVTFTGNSLLPSNKVLYKLYKNGEITKLSISEALKKYKDLIKSKNFDIKDIIEIASKENEVQTYDHAQSIASIIDKQSKNVNLIKSDVIVDISRFFQLNFDNKVSKLKVNSKDKSLYSNWVDFAINSRGMNARGYSDFNKNIKKLPLNYLEVIEFIVNKLNLNSEEQINNYFCSLLFELQGWAGYLRKQNFLNNNYNDIKELLAIRINYDFALLENLESREKSKILSIFLSKLTFTKKTLNEFELVSLILHEAYENSIQNEFKNKFENIIEKKSAPNPLAQVVFCIDVRSEIIRRQLGVSFPEIETYGFAGFFGLPLAVVNKFNEALPHCPVLLEPSIKAKEIKLNSLWEKILEKNQTLIKLFSKSGNSCFSYVETFGFLAFFKLIKELLLPSILSGKSYNKADYKLSLLDVNTKLALAKGILKNMGLNKPYAKYVVLCGHGSTSANNPQNAGLECGACCGHAGIANAKIVAQILNCKDVRKALLNSEYEIPEETTFIAALHNTMTDEIDLETQDKVAIINLETKFRIASEKVRDERHKRLNLKNNKQLLKKLNIRANDISETRPEWALANNSAFVIAKTNSIRDLNFNGRAFLHNYNPEYDQDFSTLETILTAPMVVASWINLQYYASSVSPELFGSGNKTIHNVSSGIGIINGNDGDLNVGLSMQSVFNGDKLEHKPSRLNVFVQSNTENINKILEKHANINDLIKNNWINLFSLGKDLKEFKRCIESGTWINA